MTTELLFGHGAPPHILIARREMALRQDAMDATVDATANARSTLQQWANTLELTVLITAVQEAFDVLGVRTFADAVPLRDRIDQTVRMLSRLDVERVIRDNGAAIAAVGLKSPPPEQSLTVDRALLAHAIRSLLLNCPIDNLEQIGARVAAPELSHRCRVAFDSLKGFVARAAHAPTAAVRAAGHAYAEGRLETDEVATMLGLAVPDAVALLEQHGYARDVAKVRLGDDERNARLRAIRADREARKGEPVFDAERADRDVIASQRIEGVDARPWLRP